jgi:HSP20 family protein
MYLRRFVDFPEASLLGRWDELENMRRQINRLAENFKTGFLPDAGVFPLVNVTEDQDNYYVRAELPGISSEDIEITASEGNIAIIGERKIADEGGNVKYHRRERDSGKFNRVIGLPGSVNADKVEAKFSNGILTIILPKSEASKPRRIEIK